jgi:O-antigen/teichoic acid export membrane protein
MTARAAAVGRRRAAVDVAIQLVGRFANLALGVVVTALIVRSLGEEGFGEWNTLYAITALAGMLGQFGLEQATVRQAAAHPEQERELLGALLGLRVAVMVPTTIASVALIVALSDSHAMLVAGLLLSGLQLLTPPSSMRVVFQLRVRNDVPIAVMTINSVVWAAAVIALAAADAGIVAFAAALLLTTTATNTLLAGLALRIERPRLAGARARWPELLRVGVPLGLVSVLTLAYGQIDAVLVFQIAGDKAAGLYGAMYRILDSAGFIPLTLMTTLFPIISAAHPIDLDRVRRLVQLAMDYLTMASLPVLAFVLVAGDKVVRLLFGEDFVVASPALAVLMGAFVVICFGYIWGNMVVVLRLQKQFVVFAVIALVVNVGLNLLLIPPLGYMAAAWVTLITETLVNTLAGRAVLRGIHVRPALWRIARVALAAAVMAGAVWALQRAGVGLAGLIVAAAGVYATALLAVRAVKRSEIRMVLARGETV